MIKLRLMLVAFTFMIRATTLVVSINDVGHSRETFAAIVIVLKATLEGWTGEPPNIFVYAIVNQPF